MKLLGLSCGRIMGNTEVLVKEALMGAEEEGGVEVQFVRLLDMDIKPCRFCKQCMKRMEGRPEACVIKDDGPFLYNCIMDADGIIIGVPVYAMDRPGELKMFEDRMLGPYVDADGTRQLKENGGIDFLTGRKINYDERILKRRVGGFIENGGASTLNWHAFALPLLYTFTFPPQIDIIDHLVVTKAQPYPPGLVVVHEKSVKRARLLGKHIASAMKKPIEEMKWMGDEPGTCPVCHCNLLIVSGKNPVECPVCGISGTLKVEGDRIIVDFPESEKARSRLTMAGKHEHLEEINHLMAELLPRAPEVPAMIAKYQNYLKPLKPEKKTK